MIINNKINRLINHHIKTFKKKEIKFINKDHQNITLYMLIELLLLKNLKG